MSTATTKSARPVPTFDRLAKKKPMEHVEWIPLDEDTLEAYEEAKNELGRAKLLDEPDHIAKAEKDLKKAREQLESTSVRMVFRSMGRARYDDLIRQFPPTPEQVEEHKSKYGAQSVPEYDAEALAPHLIAEACVEPKMTPDQVRSLVDEFGWNGGEYAALFNIALKVNTTRRVADLGF